jgi:hypothetical protein
LEYSGCHISICQEALPDLPQPADFGGFYCDPASNLLAYCEMMAAICQRSPQPLRKVPTLANGLDAESEQNPDLDALLNEPKGLTTISVGLNYCSMGLSQPPSRDTVS